MCSYRVEPLGFLVMLNGSWDLGKRLENKGREWSIIIVKIEQSWI